MAACLMGPLLLLLMAMLLAPACAHKLPQFTYPQSNKIMLAWGNVWDVGVSNKLAFLTKENKLTIRIHVDGGISGSGMRYILYFKCQDGAQANTIDLTSIQPQAQYCDDAMPFTLSKVDGKGASVVEYQFEMKESKLPYTVAFTQRIELFVRVEFSTGELTSNSLFVYNLEAISKFQDATILDPDSVIGTLRKGFLTTPATNFLVHMNMSDRVPFDSFEFIDEKMIKLIASAPAFIRVKINIGAILQFDSGDCKALHGHLNSLFVNYFSKMTEQHVKLLKHMMISLTDGKLHYSTYGLSTAISTFFNSKDAPIAICTITSIAGHDDVYLKVDEVIQRIPRSKAMYKVVGISSSECYIVGTGSSTDVSIFAGMDYTPLVCPIICADPNMPYSFNHNGQQLVPQPEKDWTIISGIRVSRIGNVIEFPVDLFKRNSGQYKCSAGAKSFSFNVQIIGMPQFATKVHESANSLDGNLPQTIYAMENESLSYSCSAFYTGLDSVSVTPRFVTTGTSGASQMLKELDLSAFKELFPSSSSKILAVSSDQDGSKTLNFSISSVPSPEDYYLNFTHRVICHVSVGQSDAVKVGLPSYTMQSGSNVFFLKRPTLQGFNLTKAKDCSEQQCSNKKGGDFEVSLLPELTAQLKSLGVEVNAFFRIDNNNIANLHIIRENSEWSFIPNTNTLVLRVFPTRDDSVLAELQKYKTLTPVFNFRYGSGVDIENLLMHKERYGRPDRSSSDDCRDDMRCFYSTDFDISSTLSRLAIGWNFAKEQEIAVASFASPGVISGVVLAIIIVIIAIVLLVLLLRRDPGEVYMVDEKERQQGNHPDLEAKDEQFKEYQRPVEGPMNASRMSLRSNVSIESRDDQELDAYRDEDLDYSKFTEEGSFIGEYNDQEKQGQGSSDKRHDK